MSEKEISEKMQEIMSRMKNRREELDMSYQTLSDKVGISKSTLQRYETGYIKNMPVDKLEAIADALQVSPAYLMGWSEEYEFRDAPSESHSSFDNIEDFKNAYNKSKLRKNTLEAKIIDNMSKLTNDGKKSLLDYSNILLGNPAFSSESHLEVNAAHQSRGKFTDDERQEDEDMLD